MGQRHAGPDQGLKRRKSVLFTRFINLCTIYSMTRQKNGTAAGRTVGYARVSTLEQDLRLQVDALKAQGCQDDLIFVDRASGAKAERPGLTQCLETLQAGDLLLVWRVDRLGRSMAHLVTLMEALQEQGIGFRSVCDGAIDTTTASGELVFNIFSALAQFERRRIQERTRAGLTAARGRLGGRPALDPQDARVQMAKALYQDGTHEVGGDLRDLAYLPLDLVSLPGTVGWLADLTRNGSRRVAGGKEYVGERVQVPAVVSFHWSTAHTRKI